MKFKPEGHNRALLLALVILCSLPAIAQDKPAPPDKNRWAGTPEQKIMGLYTIWAEAKYAFPFAERLKEIDWDSKVQEYAPRVLATPGIESYYDILMEFAALLKDGHTGVNPPWGPFKPGFDAPPVEIQVAEGKFIIARTGQTDELQEQRIYPGLEILAVDGGIPIRDYYLQTVLRYNSRGTPQADEAINLFWLFQGAKGSKLPLQVRDIDGQVRSVVLTRNSADKNGQRFLYRVLAWDGNEQVLESKLLSDGILYVTIFNFENETTKSKFESLIDSLDLAAIKGMIIDVRYNPGGNSSNADDVVRCLVDRPVAAEVSRVPHYVAAYRAWEKEPVWTELSNRIEPRQGKRFTGPLVILTGPATYSSAEDFIIPLHQAKRAILVGEKTAGSTGNPLRVPLPGGGNFRVVTVKCVYPDGKEFVGYGIAPDVPAAMTQKDIFEGKDPVLARGIEVLRRAFKP